MNPEKKAARKAANKAAKQKKAEQRQQFLAMLGRTVVEKEVPTGEMKDGKPVTEKVLDFPVYIKTGLDGSPLPFRGQQQSPPRLAFVGAKTYKHHGAQGKNRPGNVVLHAEAIVEDASRTFAKEVDKILNPPQETPTVPVVPVDAAELAAQI